MPAKTKKLRFQYFKVLYMEGADDNAREYDIEGLLKEIAEKELDERVATIRQIRGRLEEMKLVPGEDHLYALRFMRLDDTSNDYKVKLNKPAEHVDLGDDEFLGRNTFALYDAVRHIMAVQINRVGFGVSCIQGYLNFFAGEDEEKCYIQTMLNRLDLEHKINGGCVRKLKISFRDVRKCSAGRSKFWERVLNGGAGMGAKSLNIAVSVGRDKQAQLNSGDILYMLADIGENSGYINSAVMTIREDECDTIINMLEDVVHDDIEVRIPPRKELDSEEVTNAIALKFNRKMRTLIDP